MTSSLSLMLGACSTDAAPSDPGEQAAEPAQRSPVARPPSSTPRSEPASELIEPPAPGLEPEPEPTTKPALEPAKPEPGTWLELPPPQGYEFINFAMRDAPRELMAIVQDTELGTLEVFAARGPINPS